MSTAVTRQELAEIIGEKTLHIKDKQRLIQSVAAYLSDANSTFDIDSLIRDIIRYRQEKGLIEAMAVSAHELSSEVLHDIKLLLKDHYPHAKHIMLDQRMDDAIVGGIRIELPNETLDLSVRAKLNNFKRLVAEERN